MLKKHIAGKIDQAGMEKIEGILASLKSNYSKPVGSIIDNYRRKRVEEITARVMEQDHIKNKSISDFLGRMSMHPAGGIPVAALILYLTYKIVGEFGAGTCVDFMESIVFGEYINPLFIRFFKLIPVQIIQELFIGEYGVVTMAMTYAVAIVLPIVGFFFIVFGILEDSGYLPRLAIMVNRIFRAMGG
ncbi:MAG: hypothetical protein ABIA63_14780 [bacterium]